MSTFLLALVVNLAIVVLCRANSPRLRRREKCAGYTASKHIDAFFGDGLVEDTGLTWRAETAMSLSLSMEYDETPSAVPPTMPPVADPSPVSISSVPTNHPELQPSALTPESDENPTQVPTVLSTTPTIVPVSDLPTLEPTELLTTQAPARLQQTTSGPTFSPSPMPSTDMPTFVSTELPTISTDKPTSAPPSSIGSITPSFAPSTGQAADAPSSGLGSGRIECDDHLQRQTDLHTTLSIITSDVDDPSTPSGKAFSWIVHDDSRRLCSKDRSLMSRFGLATLYYATSGEHWISDDTNPLFLSSRSECDWTGIHCNAEGAVRFVELDGRNLTGTIPSEVASIETLRVLGLKDNQIYGTLPQSLNKLHPFLVLRVQNNHLSGTIPSGLSSSLVRLLVQDNDITGTLPIGNMTKLRILQVQNNEMTGTIPLELASATDLSMAHFTGNSFSGSIPEEICTLFVEHKLDELTADCPALDCPCCTNDECANV